MHNKDLLDCNDRISDVGVFFITLRPALTEIKTLDDSGYGITGAVMSCRQPTYIAVVEEQIL